MPKITIDLTHKSGPHVVYPSDADEEDVEAAVEREAPGWTVDWDEPESTVGRTKLSLPLRRLVGRPARAGVPADKITIRATAAEREAWQRLAGERSLSDWIRERCNAAAARGKS